MEKTEDQANQQTTDATVNMITSRSHATEQIENTEKPTESHEEEKKVLEPEVKPKAKYQIKGSSKGESDSDKIPENPNRQDDNKKKDKRKKPNKQKKKEEKKEKMESITTLDFTNYKTHDQCAEAVVAALNSMARVYPSAVKDVVPNCFKRNLKNGLKQRSEIQTEGKQSIDEAA